ncbi:hypothetical protein HUT06_17165 [Actinomadura sp. NAK00032]|uniref:DUF6297 family protein n=1 Tax=Actinomadura sp. NAK00032 TaxID=2742128 RepID=UPI001590DE5B|nr:DUF6297 family protein [Actinomadura sp. NAK00032]QKW35551.1 hypothetical protein HUT06_17165 [Actinomadura sp. NAK00032]
MTAVDVRPAAGAVPGARDLRRRLRSGRPRRTRADVLSLLLERVLYIALLGGFAVGAVRDGLGRDGAAAAEPETSVVRLVSAAAALLCLVLVAKCLLAFGPLYAGAPARMWLLGTPVDRGRLLTGRLAAAVAAGAASSAAIGTAFVLTAGLAVPLAPWLALWTAAGAVSACACVLAQVRLRSLRGVQRVLGGAAYALAAAMAAIPIVRPGQLLTELEQASANAYTACASAALVVAAIAVAVARGSLGGVTRAAVSPGVELARAARVSVLSVDFTFFWSIALERRARAVVRVKPASIGGGRFAAMVRVDLARVLRTRPALFVWAALMAVPYAAHVAGLAAFLPAVHMVAAFLAVDRLAGGLRLVARSPAIRRALGGSDRSLMLAHLVVPAAGAVVWSAVTAATVPGVSALTAALSAAGAVAVGYRAATRPSLDYSGGLIDLGLFPPIPMGLFLQLARGPALLTAFCVLQIAVARVAG